MRMGPAGFARRFSTGALYTANDEEIANRVGPVVRNERRGVKAGKDFTMGFDKFISMATSS